MALAALLLSPASVCAHPMGNFSISHYAAITIEGHFVELRYFIDMAEIPTFQELQQSGMEARLDDPRLAAYLSSKAQTFLQGLEVTLNQHALTLGSFAQDVIFPPGAGNLPTMKFGFIYRAEFAADCGSRPCQLEYQDTNFADRAGWKEIVVATGPGVRWLSGTAPERDRSNQLSNYPTDLLHSPPQELQAEIVFSAAAAQWAEPFRGVSHGPQHRQPKARAASVSASKQPSTPSTKADPGTVGMKIGLKPNAQATPRNRFTELTATKRIDLNVALFAALIAAGLGALHALEPGHGKTIVAAYLVGSKGTARHALLLGMIVTASHTAGVYLLGAITLYAQKYVLPDRIYPFLGVLSGVLIAGMGGYLFLQRYLGEGCSHSHSYDDTSVGTPGRGPVSARQVLVLGVSGGIVPCPAALVVLLSAAALHRTGFGLYLIVAFSVGLAAVLIAMGLAAVYAKRVMSRLPLEGPLVQRWLPMASAAVITILGAGIAIRGLMAAGIVGMLTGS